MRSKALVLVMALVAGSALAVRATRASGAREISGPYVHANLAVFLIHGADAAPGRTFLTLEEALAAKKAIVRETGSVNELAIENVSQEDDVYIQAGDIVRGGRQDRTIPWDTVVERGARLPLASFCVEHGRWQRRGEEAADHFESSHEALATKGLKLAAKMQSDQGAVWRNVEEAQQALSAKVGESVNVNASATSFLLSLENEKVRGSADAYVRELAAIVDARPDVIGYAFAIDGKVNSADIYASRALFRKLWPKLLRASAIEAVASAGAAPGAAPAKGEIVAFLADAESGKPAAARPAAQPRLQVFNGARAQVLHGRVMDDVAARRAAELRAAGDLAQAQAIEGYFATTAEQEAPRLYSESVETANGAITFSIDVAGSMSAQTAPPARVEDVTKETERNIFFETRDRALGGKWIHRSYMAK